MTRQRPRVRFLKLRPRLLVGCEGEKTEYEYLTCLNKYRVQSSGPVLVVLRPRHSDPVDVVGRVITKRAQEKSKGEFDPARGDQCFAVLDVEPHDRAKAARIADAIRLAETRGVSVLLSNPCFEFCYSVMWQKFGMCAAISVILVRWIKNCGGNVDLARTI